MEKLIIQADSKWEAQIENFVRAICEGNHIPHYYAAISVPVLKASTFAFRHDAVTQLSIVFEYCFGGVQFTLQADSQCFTPLLSSEIPASGSDEEFLYLVKILSDQMSVLDDGRSLRVSFNVIGIPFSEAADRVRVLENFYAQQRLAVLASLEG